MIAKSNKKKNLFIILALALLAAGLLIASRFLPSPNSQLTPEEIQKQQSGLGQTEADASPALDAPGYVFIILENRVWGIEALGEEREITVDQGNGVVNVIHLLPDGYYMKSSTCDNQLCVTEGTVTTDNYQQRILGPCVYCLPHNLMLELVVPNVTPDPSAPDAWN